MACRPIARPSRHQRIWYSGHKRLHVQKFQAIMTPFGIVIHLFGPVEGTRHDSAMLRMSGLNQLQNDLPPRSAAPGDGFAIYGDSAYPLRTNLQVPFTGLNLTPDETAFNTRMSECRVCMVWGFADITAKFSSLAVKKKQRLLHQPVGMYYAVATLLTNCHTCLYGNETSRFFDLTPPTLDQYLV